MQRILVLNQLLNMSDHIDQTISSCASSQFALRTLKRTACVRKSCNWLPDWPPSPPCYMSRRHGGALPPQSSVADWRSFCWGSEEGGFLPWGLPVVWGVGSGCRSCVVQIYQLQPVPRSRHYFREREHTGHNLHPRAHNFALLIKDNRNFISRVLYRVLN